MAKTLTTMTIIYSNVNITRGDRVILSDVNLQAKAGEMIYLTGQVGAGKSSLLASMYGDADVCAGTALVLEQDMRRIKRNKVQQLRRQLGLVHQDLRLLSDRTVYDNLDFVLRATDWDSKESRTTRIREVLNWVDLPDKAGCYPHELSGGQKQRICIARAILNHPRLILADEPTGQLDTENGERVMALLDEVRRQTNATVVVSTHNLQWPDIFPGTVYVCEDGSMRPKGQGDSFHNGEEDVTRQEENEQITENTEL